MSINQTDTIILNYNSSKDTIKLYKQLEVYYPELKTIVIDNNSIESEKDLLKIHINSKAILFNDKNYGYAEGNNVSFNFDIHIGCIDEVEIGNNCLFASRIFITDHHHGDTSKEMLELAPAKRPLISKGKVKIEKNVWIGEGVAIMPNVNIGENSIIAANAVVTKDIPKNSVAAGIPAKVIKIIR